MAKKKTPHAPDTSPYIYQQKKVAVNFTINERIPWTERQLECIRLAQAKTTKLLFISGPAGTGKSVLAVYCGLQALLQKQISDIIYARAIVESSSQSIGWLPGDIATKLGPFSHIVHEKLDELVGAEERSKLVSSGLVTTMPVGHLRGNHFSVKYVIGDEMQSWTKKETGNLLTRIGEKSKVILCGDPMQIDIAENQSGFVKYMEAFDTEEAREHGIHVFKFTKEDIVRSELLKYIVEVMEKM